MRGWEGTREGKGGSRGERRDERGGGVLTGGRRVTEG